MREAGLVDFASLVLGNMLNMVCFHVSGTSPQERPPKQVPQCLQHNFGRMVEEFSDQPCIISSLVCLQSCRATAILSSAMVQGASVKQGWAMGMPRILANNCCNMLANSNGCGCCGNHRPVPYSIVRKIFHFEDCPIFFSLRAPLTVPTDLISNPAILSDVICGFGKTNAFDIVDHWTPKVCQEFRRNKSQMLRSMASMVPACTNQTLFQSFCRNNG